MSGKAVVAKGLLRCDRREPKSVFFAVALQEQQPPIMPGEWAGSTGNDHWAPKGLRKGKYVLTAPPVFPCNKNVYLRSVVRLNIGGKKAGFRSGGRKFRSVSRAVRLC